MAWQSSRIVLQERQVLFQKKNERGRKFTNTEDVNQNLLSLTFSVSMIGNIWIEIHCMKEYYRTGLQWHRLLFLMLKMLVVLFWKVKAINLPLWCDDPWEFASSDGPGSLVSRTNCLKLCFSIKNSNIFFFCLYSELIYEVKWLKCVV